MRALATRPALVFLLFLPVIPNLIGAMDFNRRLFRRSHDRIASFLATHPVDRALVLCDDAVFSQYGFGQLRPGLPPDRPVFARDVHSADLAGRFADRPAFRFAYDSTGRLVLEKHIEPVVDLYELIANGHPSIRAIHGMQTATHVLTLDSLQGETHKLLYGFRTPASVTVALQIPPDAFLRFSAIVHPDAWARGSNGVTFRLTLLPDGASERSEPIEIYRRHLGRDCSPMALLDQEVDLRPWAGKTAQIRVQAQPGPDDPHRGATDVFDISNLRIIRRVVP